MKEIEVFERLEAVPPDRGFDDFVVVDVLRFSTTLVALLDGGAEFVKPFGSREAALEARSRGEVELLAGESGGVRLEGFDLGNSPTEVREAEVGGARVGVVTTNGTRAVRRLSGEGRVLSGAPVNAPAVAEALDGEVALVAVGREGEVADEDMAGAELIRKLAAGGTADMEDLNRRVRESESAERLMGLGYGDDLEAVLEFDSSKTVPVLEGGRFLPLP